ncbi:hypothetical protein [Thermodesulfatator autotrophicus]|nr:hypothetical protein [Thermodesulfatator autotrophicus]
MKRFFRFVLHYFKNSPWYMWVIRIGLALLLFKLFMWSQKLEQLSKGSGG